MKRSIIFTSIILAIVFAVLSIVSTFVAYRNAQEIGETTLKLSQRIGDLDEQVKLLAVEAELLSRKVLSEDEYRVLLEDAQNKNKESQLELETRLESLSQNFGAIDDRFDDLEALDTALIAKEWEPFVYSLECEFTDSNGEIEKTNGSAVVELAVGTNRLITNKHVLTEDNMSLSKCILSQPTSEQSFTVSRENISIDDDRDVGYGLVSSSLASISTSDRCSTKPSIGDEVLILGFPGIGAKESVTATDGIISGFEKNYYLTSAKIDKGSSGGAAIHIRNNCFIGLPTVVVAGRVESLARILPLLVE